MARTITQPKKTQGGNGDSWATSRAKQADTTPDSLRQRIEQKAYQIFAQRGFSHGNDLADWYEAEKQVRKEIR